MASVHANDLEADASTPVRAVNHNVSRIGSARSHNVSRIGSARSHNVSRIGSANDWDLSIPSEPDPST